MSQTLEQKLLDQGKSNQVEMLRTEQARNVTKDVVTDFLNSYGSSIPSYLSQESIDGLIDVANFRWDSGEDVVPWEDLQELAQKLSRSQICGW